MSEDADVAASGAKETLIDATANMPKEMRTQVLKELALLRKPIHLYDGNLAPAQEKDIEPVACFTTTLETNDCLKKEYEDIFYQGNLFVVVLRSEADVEYTASGPQLRVAFYRGYHLGRIYHLRLMVHLDLNSYNHISREDCYKAIARFATKCNSLRSATIHFLYSPRIQGKTIGPPIALYTVMKEVLKAMWLHVPSKVEHIKCCLTEDNSNLVPMEGRSLQGGESINTQEEATDPAELAWVLAIDWRLEMAQGAKVVEGKLLCKGGKQLAQSTTGDG